MTYSQFLSKLIIALDKYHVEYMIIGGGSALLQGFNLTTEDIDIYPNDNKTNNESLILALESLNYQFTDKEVKDLLSGKDFNQFEEPFPLDIVYYPDGFNSFNEAKKYLTYSDEGLPLLSIEGIIKSKTAANRPKDRVVLPLLKDFLYFITKGKLKETYSDSDSYYDVPIGYYYADNQTIHRWQLNRNKNWKERIDRGIIGKYLD